MDTFAAGVDIVLQTSANMTRDLYGVSGALASHLAVTNQALLHPTTGVLPRVSDMETQLAQVLKTQTDLLENQREMMDAHRKLLETQQVLQRSQQELLQRQKAAFSFGGQGLPSTSSFSSPTPSAIHELAAAASVLDGAPVEEDSGMDEEGGAGAGAGSTGEDEDGDEGGDEDLTPRPEPETT